MTKISKLFFNSPTSILAWAGVTVGQRLGDAWYVRKEELYYYFGKYENGYQLVMMSEKDLGE